MSGKLNSKEIRKRIGHPVIDADGHWLEFGPAINDYMKDVAGADAVNSFRRRGGYVRKISHHDARGARADASCAGSVLGSAGEKYPRPRHRDAAPSALRSPR